MGDNTTILSYARIQSYHEKTSLPPVIKIGSHCSIGYYFSVVAAADIIIDDWVLIASNVLITSHNHGMDPESEIPYMTQDLTTGPVHIGRGCWIGEKVCILPGVTIGEKCIVGAGAVVSKSVPPYSIVAGNPAKVIKKYNFQEHKWN